MAVVVFAGQEQQPAAVRRPLRHECGTISALLFAADSSTLISGSVDTTIKLWDVAKLLPGK
ncbi:MAG TPA: WD40 repeat domain-containing protein [Gemmataceae bacterium]